MFRAREKKETKIFHRTWKHSLTYLQRQSPLAVAGGTDAAAAAAGTGRNVDGGAVPEVGGAAGMRSCPRRNQLVWASTVGALISKRRQQQNLPWRRGSLSGSFLQGKELPDGSGQPWFQWRWLWPARPNCCPWSRWPAGGRETPQEGSWFFGTDARVVWSPGGTR